MSVTSYPLRDGPTSTSGRMEGTTSYGGMFSCFLKKGFRFSLAGGVVMELFPLALPRESESSPTLESNPLSRSIPVCGTVGEFFIGQRF